MQIAKLQQCRESTCFGTLVCWWSPSSFLLFCFPFKCLCSVCEIKIYCGCYVLDLLVLLSKFHCCHLSSLWCLLKCLYNVRDLIVLLWQHVSILEQELSWLIRHEYGIYIYIVNKKICISFLVNFVSTLSLNFLGHFSLQALLHEADEGEIYCLAFASEAAQNLPITFSIYLLLIFLIKHFSLSWFWCMWSRYRFVLVHLHNDDFRSVHLFNLLAHLLDFLSLLIHR